ncbi:MAG: hypothetical protein GAK35_02536 [Herbaspirillum frisingense]|uniref:Uncharacterized protein n=1 Tax=Herbaspirillum frisingense TaxID=92645 RepID=A0A7V8FVW7_9BURK|nr:MAG: hypothetical protein GAK35_02536 [Herbaspirillum frisingense]
MAGAPLSAPPAQIYCRPRRCACGAVQCCLARIAGCAQPCGPDGLTVALVKEIAGKVDQQESQQRPEAGGAVQCAACAHGRGRRGCGGFHPAVVCFAVRAHCCVCQEMSPLPEAAGSCEAAAGSWCRPFCPLPCPSPDGRLAAECDVTCSIGSESISAFRVWSSGNTKSEWRLFQKRGRAVSRCACAASAGSAAMAGCQAGKGFAGDRPGPEKCCGA